MTTVVRHYLKLCTDKVENAEGKVNDTLKAIADVDDFDEYGDQEGALLAMVTEDDNEVRTKKAMLMPWVKFLWEAHRTCLEVLRNNAKLEHLYQEVAQRAFKFCLKFKRRNEFGRLCDQLRRHFGHILKYQNQQNAINLSNPESLQLHLETRFEQLNTAAKMDLWKNAFASIEDINNLMDMSKKAPKPQMLAMYYQKLAMIFWKSGDFIFHATSWHKIFQFTKEHKKTFGSSEEAQQMASCVLLSTLCIPITNAGAGLMNNEPGYELEKNHRLCALVGITSLPTREELIAQCVSMNIMQYVPPQLKELYSMLEQQYHPLNLCQTVTPIVDFLKTQKKLAHYAPPLQNVTVLRLLKQMSQVYSTVSMARLYELIPFSTPFEIEEFLVRSVTKRVISVRLNHREKSLAFGSALLMAEEEPDEGPQLQALQSEMLRSQLTTLSKRLRISADMIAPGKRSQDTQVRRQQVYEQIVNKIEREHAANLGRKTIIESRKEFIEMQAMVKTQQVHKQRYEAIAAHRKKEMDRLATEAELREKDKIIKEQKDIQRANALEKVEELKKTAIGAQAFKDIKLEELEQMDADQIMQVQVDQLEKNKREAAIRLRAHEKKHDYLERAKRAEEMKLFVDQVKSKKEAWVEKSKGDHVVALEIKKRLERMVPSQKIFIDEVLGARQQAYEQERAAFDRKMEAQTIRLDEEDQKRRVREEQEEREQEERDRKAEEQRRIQEEEAAELREQQQRDREARDAQDAARREEIDAADRRRMDERNAPGGGDDRGGDGGGWQAGGRPQRRERDDRGGGGGGGERPRLNLQGGGGGGGGWRERAAARGDDDRGPPQGGDRGPPQGGDRGGGYGGDRGGDRGGGGGSRYPGGDRGGDRGGDGGSRYPGGDRGGDGQFHHTFATHACVFPYGLGSHHLCLSRL